MEILIQDRQDRYRIDPKQIEKKAKTVLEALGSPNVELSLLIVDDKEIADLNREYLDRSGPTNVIAFPMHEGPFGNITPSLLGDIVISLDAAAREGLDGGMTTEARFDELLVHGILHLFGFDHEESLEEAETMRIKEEQLLKLLSEST